MRFPNLIRLPSKPSLAVPIHGKSHTQGNKMTDFTNRIIDHALYRFLPKEQADAVIYDYRRSPWNEDSLKVDIDKLDSDHHPVPKDEHYENAINHLKMLLTPETPLLPIHFADLRRYKWRLSTNIGAPFASSSAYQDYVTQKWNFEQFGTPFLDPISRDLFTEAHRTSQPLKMQDARMTKHNLYNEAFFITRTNIHNIKLGRKTNDKGHDYRYWNTAFARQHLVKKDDPDKVRLVFGAPFTLLTAELMFIWPLQIFLLTMKGSKSFMLWNFETILGGWYRLRNFFATYAPRHTTVVTLDWSGFDRNARHEVIRDIHSRVLRPMFSFSKGYHPTRDYPSYTDDPNDIPIHEKLENLWSWMTDSVLSIPLLMPDGTMYRFSHSGIFSGYFQTQILDSLYNLIMIFTILSRLGFDLKKVVIKVQGDDSIFMLLCCFLMISTSFMSLFQFYATHYFEAKVSTEKSEIRDTLEGAEVLKYRNKGGIPFRPSLDLLAQLRHPERSTRPEAVASRCIGIAYAACGQDHSVYLICEDIFLYLTQKKGISPSQRELNRFFQHLDINSSGSLSIKVDHFPSWFETMQHLVDHQISPIDRHWPSDYFLGIPGRL